jgi:hypothetical protein
MKRLALLLILLPLQALAGECIWGPRISTDKELHLVGNAVVVSGVAWGPGNLWYGLAAGLAVSAAREEYKHLTPGESCEYNSMIWDAAGMAIGAAGYHWVIEPRQHGAVLAYSRTF